MARSARRRAEPFPEGRPLVLAAPDRGTPRLMAINPEAFAAGLRPGLSLTDARAICPTLTVREAEPARDMAALRALALWCRRWSPRTATDGADGILLDLAGCCHLFGGEAGVLAAVTKRLGAAGLTMRAAVAGQALAAWAWARFGAGGLLDPEEARARLKELPVAALNIDGMTATALRRLGLQRIGQLLPLPRASLRRRFGAVLPERLEQMFGAAEPAFVPLREPARFVADLNFAEPIGRNEDVEMALCRLLERVCRDLERAQMGGRRWRLRLWRVDGDLVERETHTGRPCRDAGHVAWLMALGLDGLDAGFGIELMRLEALETTTLDAEQTGLAENTDVAALTRLIDRLAARLGEGRVLRLEAVDSHWPERAMRLVPAGTPPGRRTWLAGQPRPLRLLRQPQPIVALARVPDGPPVQVGLGRSRQRVIRAIGPERILPEWWRTPGVHLRDYYEVTLADGRSLWVYREGAYDEPEPPTWWLHGLFL
jgi:protein ImuB